MLIKIVHLDLLGMPVPRSQKFWVFIYFWIILVKFGLESIYLLYSYMFSTMCVQYWSYLGSRPEPCFTILEVLVSWNAQKGLPRHSGLVYNVYPFTSFTCRALSLIHISSLLRPTLSNSAAIKVGMEKKRSIGWKDPGCCPRLIVTLLTIWGWGKMCSFLLVKNSFDFSSGFNLAIFSVAFGSEFCFPNLMHVLVVVYLSVGNIGLYW